MRRSQIKVFIWPSMLFLSDSAHAHGEGALVAFGSLVLFVVLVGVGFVGAYAAVRRYDWKSAIVWPIAAVLFVSIAGGVLLGIKTGNLSDILILPLTIFVVGILPAMAVFFVFYRCAKFVQERNDEFRQPRDRAL